MGMIAKRYKRLLPARQHFLDEAVTSAALTLPHLAPDNEDAGTRDRMSPVELVKPWQSTGSRGVRNLASKLLLTLFPPTGAFVRYEVSQAAIGEGPEKELLSEIENALAKRERQVARELDIQSLRAKIFTAIKLLLVTGNALGYMPPSGGMRIFPLNSYVVRRDFTGNLLELIYVEVLDRATIDAKYAVILDAVDPMDPSDDDKMDKPVRLYTRVLRVKKRFVVSQEVNGEDVPKAAFSVPVKHSPWLVLRFTAVDGEDYGRSFVEEFRGDLTSLERLRKSIVIASLNAAKLNPLVKPNSTLTPRKLTNAANGEVLIGNSDDVTMLQQNKGADMRVAGLTSTEVKQDLAAAFMLNSSFQRSGERVTAEEIRTMAEDLEDGLGGVFSLLAVDLQLPVAVRLEAQLIRKGELQPLPPDTVEPTVVTGLAAIGRGHELNRLREGMSIMAEVEKLSPGSNEFLRQGTLVKRVWTGVGVPTEDLLRSEEEVGQIRADMMQKQQQSQARQVGMEGAAPHFGKVAAEKAGEAGRLDPDQIQETMSQMQNAQRAPQPGPQ